MTRWTAEEDAKLREMYATHTRPEIAAVLGRTEGMVRSRCWTTGLNTKVAQWSDADLLVLREEYAMAARTGALDTRAIAKRLGRTVDAVEIKAGRMGITSMDDMVRRFAIRPRATVERRVCMTCSAWVFGKRKTCSEACLKETQRKSRWGAERPHPRGSQGMKHSPESLAKISASSSSRWERMSPSERRKHVRKSQDALTRSGNRNKTRSGTTWKAAWREIGGVRKYYRSRWEANYARYLEWMRGLGKVAAWAHEPDVFWFKGIRRGCVSYLPDFRVELPDGSVEYHEVKGWMDAASKTKIKRMAKYHPSVKLVVIDSKAYRQLASAVAALVGEWE